MNVGETIKMNGATLTKIQDAQPAGTPPASTKETADIIVVGYGKNDRTEVMSRKLLSGAGIKKLGQMGDRVRYMVDEDAMCTIRRMFSVATDF